MTAIPSFEKNLPLSREDFAYEAIKEAILSGELAPSQKISLRELANNLGVSIIPVNTAVGRLISEGLIRQDPHHSPYVVEFSARAVKEVLTIRYHMEELALSEAIPHIGEQEILGLYHLINQMEGMVRENDTHHFGIFNRSFHMTIYTCSQLPMLCDMINDLWNKAELNRCRSVFWLVPNMLPHSHQEHKQLVELIAQKNTSEAIALLRRHKAYSRDHLLEALEKDSAE